MPLVASRGNAPAVGFGLGGFLAPVDGDFESIATVTVGSGGASSIEFTSIPGTYQHLQIRGMSKTAAGGDGLPMRINGDTGSNYAYHLLYGTGASAAAAAGTSQTQTVAGNQTYSGTNASTFSGFVLDILDYASTSKNKTVRSLSGYDLNGSGEIRLSSGLWMSTSAVTSISLTGNGGNLAQHSTFALYGIKAP